MFDTVGPNSLAIVALISALGVVGIVLASCVRRDLPVWLGLILLFLGNAAGTESSAGTPIPLLAYWGRFFPTLAIGVFIAAGALRGSLKIPGEISGRGLVVSYVPFCILLAFSAVYNGSGLLDTVLSFGIYLRYPFFFILLINSGHSVERFERFLKAFGIFTLLQILVSVYEAAAKGQWAAGVEGTLGSNHGLVGVVLFAQCYFLANWLAARRRRNGYLMLALALLIPSLVGDIMIGIIIFPIITTFLVVRYYGLSRFVAGVRMIFTNMLIALALCSLLYLTVGQIRSSLDTLLLAHKVGGHRETIDWRDKSVANWTSIGRVTILPLSFPLLLEDPLRLVWGFGPEAARGGVTSAELDSGIACQKLLEQGILCRGPQTLKSLMEFGVLGSFLQIFPLLYLWRSIGRRLRRSSTVNRQVIWLTFQGACLMNILLLPWYIGVWRMDWFCFPFWLIAAAAYVAARDDRSSPNYAYAGG